MQALPRKGSRGSFLFIISLLCLLNGLRSACAQALTFTTNTFATDSKNPYCVAAADINNDGKLDLISASGILDIFTNNGDCVFGSNAMTSASDFVMAADVNGDGYVDLLTPGSHSIQIYTNDGNGHFALSGAPAVGAGQYFAAADINGDGSLDLINGNCFNNVNSLTILTNDGIGNFGSNTTVSAPSPLCVVAADVNGDGHIDLITTSDSASSVTILTNDGYGNFGSNATLHIDSGSDWRGAGPDSLVYKDINNDGKGDIITANYVQNTLSIFTNNGTGVFGLNATIKLGNAFDSEGVSWVVAADLNGDGSPDLAAVNYEKWDMYILTNNGTGVFGSNTTLTIRPWPTWITAADLNGDGKPDLIIAGGQDNSLSVFLNTSPFPPPKSTPPLSINSIGSKMVLSWPSDSAGWSLQQNPDLSTSNWMASGLEGYGIADDETNKSLLVTRRKRNLFFRLLHP